jgi:cation:H+ antiporter
VTGLILLALSAALLTVGAELFAEHAARAGRRIGVTALAVGLVVAGAEPEELVTAVFASARHRGGIAVGDAIGANITMLTLVLGLIAVLVGLPIGKRVRGYAFAAAGAGTVAAVLLSVGRLTRAGGAVLVAAYVGGLFVVWRIERRPPAIGELTEAFVHGSAKAASPASEDPVEAGGAVAVLLLLVGVGIMALGGRLAVSGAEQIVDSLGLADSAVGLTFVALATTAELFALAWSAARRGITELAVAGVIGSAAYNATATLGVAALIHPLPNGGVTGAAWLAAGLPLLIVALGGPRGELRRLAGFAVLTIYSVYLVLVLI